MNDCMDCELLGETCQACLLAEECPGCGEMYEGTCPTCVLTLTFVPPDEPRYRKEGDCVRCYDEPAKYDYPVADRTIRVGGKCWYGLTGRAYRAPEFQEATRD